MHTSEENPHTVDWTNIIRTCGYKKMGSLPVECIGLKKYVAQTGHNYDRDEYILRLYAVHGLV